MSSSKQDTSSILGLRQITTRPSAGPIVDPHQAVILGPRAQAEQRARALLAEAAQLQRLCAVLLERTGPVEVAIDDLENPAMLYEIEAYESTDGLSRRYVSKRVRG